jgi:hypothetical protein
VIHRAAQLDLLRSGALTVTGRLLDASNGSFCATVRGDGVELACVYKPLRGERPLDDFPDGTLGRREVAAFAVSEAVGWDIVPPTAWRDDGPYGPGMAQLWIDLDPAVDLMAILRTDHPALRRIVVFDAIVNNGDRKGGHLLPVGERIHGVDHGVCFSVEPKLRTILWGWRGRPLEDDAVDGLARVATELRGALAADLARLLTRSEVDATAARVERLLRDGVYPLPDTGRRVVPWPPF